jgi:protein gp37
MRGTSAIATNAVSLAVMRRRLKMGEISAISWTHGTFNPWWGCSRIEGSPACGPKPGESGAICYAEVWSNRTGFNTSQIDALIASGLSREAAIEQATKFPIWGAHEKRRYFGDKHWAEPLKWNRSATADDERRRVFCMSMGDWAEGRPDQAPHLERLWKLWDETPMLDKLMLTKRPQLINKLMPEHMRPRSDIWQGITAENQHWLKIRWESLKQVDAAIYWLSVEPMFGPLWLPRDFLALGKRAWVICGGQSGANAQKLDVMAARSLRDQCQAAGVRFHFKQMSGNTKAELQDIPDDLRVREYPEAA